MKIPSNKNLLIAIILLGVVIGVTVAIYQNRTKVRRIVDNPVQIIDIIRDNSTPDGVSSTTPSIFKNKRLLIIPNSYELTEDMIQYINGSKIDLIIFLNGTNEYISEFQKQVRISDTWSSPANYINLDGSGEYNKCKKSEDITTFINTEYSIVRGTCDSNADVEMFFRELKCLEVDEKCIKGVYDEFVKYGVSDSDSFEFRTYIYWVDNPLTSVYNIPSLKAEQFGYMLIPIWDSPSLPYGFIQSRYSLEYKDENDKRIDAFGIINGSNVGDFYLPPKEFVDKEINVVLRQWLEYNGVKLTEPIVSQTKVVYQEIISNKEVKSSDKIQEIAWIPEWAQSAGAESIKRNPSKWSTISPTWYIPKADGTIEYQYGAGREQLDSIIRSNGINLMPTILTFDPDLLSVILNNNLDLHVEAIANEVNDRNYYGIDIDYESTYLKDKELLFEFLEKLSVKLKSNGKKLSFTVLPKIDDRNIYSFLPQTHAVQDWKRIGNIVDEFRIMGYDYTSQFNVKAGPLSPLPWNEALIIYALQNVPAEKVVLGLPIYSHAWPENTDTNPAGEKNDKSLNSGLPKNTYSWQHSEITSIKMQNGSYSEKHNDWYGETYARLSFNGGTREMYYLSPSDIELRKELAKKYRIKGVSYWRIGGDEL